LLVEQLKAIERRIVEEIHNEGNHALMDELYSANYIYHGPGEVEIKGIESYKKHNTMMRTVFPDYHLAIKEILIEGDTLMHHFTFQGTFKGQYRGISPTGKKITFSGAILNHFEEGKLVETWEVYDRLSILQQMGVNIFQK
jgi:predicted ester cyclase